MRRREHVALIDRVGYRRFHRPDGSPFIDPECYEVTLVTARERAAEADPREVATVLAMDADDERLVTETLAGLAATRPLDRVLAVSERLLLPAARLRDRLGLPGPSEREVLPLRDKLVMKRHVAAHGIPVPDHTPIERPVDARPLLRRHGAVVLKPVLGMGGAGLHFVSDEAALDALEGRDLGWPGPYLAEARVEGDVCHVDSIVEAGRPIVAAPARYLDPLAAFTLRRPRRSVSVGSGPLREALLAFNARVLATLPWFSGAAHLEAFAAGGGQLVFCEVAGRPGGAGIAPTVMHLCGVDLYEAALLPQLGRSAPRPGGAPAPERSATGWVSLYGAPGVLRGVADPPAADWVIAATVRRRPGDRLGQHPSMVNDSVACVSVCGPDPDTVVSRLDAVVREMRVQVEET